MEIWQKWFCVIVMVLVGLFCVCAGIFNWSWFFDNRKARRLVKVFGRHGARIAYGLLGAVMIALSIAGMAAQIQS